MNYAPALRAAVVTLCAIGAAIPADGDPIVVGNFGSPSNLYQAATGAVLTGYTSPSSGVGFLDEAFAFTPSTGFTLTELDIALSYVSGTNDAVVSLWTDSGGAPGTVLASWITGPLPSFGGCCSYESFFPAGPPVTLVAGQQYWIVAVANGFDDQLMWNLNSVGATGTQASSVNQGPYTTDTAVEGAFRVIGVPEPSTAALSLLGLGIVTLHSRKKAALQRASSGKTLFR